MVRRPHRRPPAARAAPPRRGRPLDQLRGQGRPGQPPRRRLPRHRHPAHAPRTSAAGCRRCTTSSRSWPASTSPPRPWRSGPTCHYIMGGVRVDADSTAATVPGLFAAGEVAGGMHGANRLGGNSLSDLLVFGRRAGIGAAEFAQGRTGDVDARRGSDPGRHRRRRRPLRARRTGENPYDIQHDLQETMQSLVGHHPHRLRARGGPRQARGARGAGRQHLAVKGGTTYNPGWNLATDLPVDAHRLAVHDHGRAQPQGEPGRPDPRRLPDGRPRDGQGQLRRAHRRPVGRRPRASAAPRRCGRSPVSPSRSRSCRTTCGHYSRRRTDGRGDHPQQPERRGHHAHLAG